MVREIVTPRRRSSGSTLTGCRSNLQNLGTAVEIYAQDYGCYPAELSQITPGYFKTLPECPEVMSMTYAYRPDAKTKGVEFQDTYEIYCSGENHESDSALPDYPRYNGVTGLDLGVRY